jgi:2,3-dihydroxyphenylpropionate 1,2-dioxygenase
MSHPGNPSSRKPSGAGGIVGAAIVPHAPQFLSMPDTEDKAQVARVETAMRAIGDAFRALEPDLVVVLSNAHADDFVVECVPAFTIHCGDRAQGCDAHKGWWTIEGEAGYALVRALQEEGFDPAFTLDAKLGTAFTIPLDFCGYDRKAAFLPIFVNAYVPPQPLPERCFAFGRALARGFERLGRRVVVLASGGLSHYPGTPLYPNPDVATDRVIFEHLAAGNLNYLMSLDEARLDRTGNVECRSLQILAGAIGDNAPQSAIFEPSWHHTYAVVGWTALGPAERFSPLYSATPSARSELARAIFALVSSREACRSFLADGPAFASSFELAADEAEALVRLDENVLRERYSINPMLTYQAKRRVASAAVPRPT